MSSTATERTHSTVNPTAAERILWPIPQRELDRRWSAVRAAMKAEGFDSLILQNDNQYLGGYVRYFLDLPAVQAYPLTVIFPADDEMTTVSQGGKFLPFSPPVWAVRGVKARIGVPYWRSVCITSTADAEAVVEVIKQRNDKKVGIVGLGAMHAAFYMHLKENLPGVELLEASDMVDEIKAVKSADELVYAWKAVASQDKVFEAVPSLIRPGRKESEVRDDIIHLLSSLGSEEQLVMMSSAPPGTRAGHLYEFYQNRRIQAGDQVMIMIEPNGPGGYYGENGRTWVLGEPPKELLRAWDVAVEAQKLTAKLSRPGASPAAIFEANNEFLASKGFPIETRLYAHGQGYDLVERPVYRPNEHMLLKANMMVAIHPTAFTDTAYGYCCDNYLIGENSTERMHKTPQTVSVIDC